MKLRWTCSKVFLPENKIDENNGADYIRSASFCMLQTIRDLSYFHSESVLQKWGMVFHFSGILTLDVFIKYSAFYAMISIT